VPAAPGIAGYEALRAHVTGEAPVPFLPLGLAVLRRYGVGAWLVHMGATRRLEAPREIPDGLTRGDSAEFDPSTRELVRLLAGTALLVMKASHR
jgi:hypothetical protein